MKIFNFISLSLILVNMYGLTTSIQVLPASNNALPDQGSKITMPDLSSFGFNTGNGSSFISMPGSSPFNNFNNFNIFKLTPQNNLPALPTPKSQVIFIPPKMPGSTLPGPAFPNNPDFTVVAFPVKAQVTVSPKPIDFPAPTFFNRSQVPFIPTPKSVDFPPPTFPTKSQVTVSPPTVNFPSVDFSTTFNAPRQLTDLQKKFPRISSRFLGDAWSSATRNASRDFSGPSRPGGAPVPAEDFPPKATVPSDTAPISPATSSAHFGRPRASNTEAAQEASALEGVSKAVSTELNLTKADIPAALSDITITVTGPQLTCTAEAEVPAVSLTNPFALTSLPECARSKYRSRNGQCNNVAFQNRGKESTVFTRLLNPDYADGISEPRQSSLKADLPSARAISAAVIGTEARLAPTWTLMFMQFGQFLDHDLSHTPQTQLPQGATKCCDSSNTNRQCFPIAIPPQDPFYARLGQQCMEFVRSLPGTRPGCTLGPREQMNQVSAFIDGNQIYGTTADQVIALREMQNGLLKSARPVASNSRYTVLPADISGQTCSDASKEQPCFNAGDGRVNIQIGLPVLHTIFMRHHNVIAQRLRSVNPNWNDETLYQEARAIVIAQLQHITFNEFLPVMLGNNLPANLGLTLLSSGRFEGYSITTNPAIANVFAAAAFRVGHSMVTGHFSRRNPGSTQITSNETVKDSFFRTSHLYAENAVDEMIMGLVLDMGKIVEDTVVTDLSQQLFRGPTSMAGLDLVSINIQRGRDHGLPGYMRFRKFCNLRTASNFNELKTLGIFSDDVVDHFASVYKTVEDIDLYPAGISEKRSGDGIVGETFHCLIAEQFRRIRSADRFWYENNLPLNSTLSNAQLTEIRKTTFAKILCDIVSAMSSVPPRIFETTNVDGNDLVMCTSLPAVDIRAWRETN